MFLDKKPLIIQAWIMGKTRDKIASEQNVSTGTVSNTIYEWKNGIGSYNSDDIRELAIGMKKANIKPQECHSGLRILNLIRSTGIDEEQLEYFLNDFSNDCIAQQVSPGDLARVVKEVISLPSIKSNNLEDISSCIKERSRKKTELDIQIYNTRQKINNLNNEIKRKEER